MNGLMPVFSQPWAQALAWTLIHFLWQGAAIGLAAYVLLRTTRLSSNARYGVGVTAMAAMLVAPAITFAIATSSPALDAPVAVAPVAPEAADAASHGSADDASVLPLPLVPASAASIYLRLVLLAWVVGVAVLSARLLGGWIVARRLARQALQPVSHDVHVLARRVAGRIALDRIVRLFESTAVAVPVTVGWIKPVVLLPASAMSGLSASQIEALLAHELAHVRRHDYLVNLLQSAVETLLFYHPAVWWASRVIRVEREHCCDDVAVGVCDRLTYVSALSDLAAMTAAPRMALAATNGSLLSRVRRLLGQPSDEGLAASWVPAMLVALLAATVVPAVLAQAAGVGSGAAGGVQGGVANGVSVEAARGVAGGAAAGVAVGVAESAVNAGMARGVSQGVRGGIATGAFVDGRVTGGVSGQSAGQTARERAVSAEQQQALRLAELERAMAELAARARREDSDIERQRAVIALQTSAERSQAEIRQLELQVRAAMADLERAQQLVQKGMATQEAVQAAQRHVAEAQELVHRRDVERRHELQQLELTLREVEQRRERASELADLERAVVDARSRMAGDVTVERQREVLARLAEVARQADRQALSEAERAARVAEVSDEVQRIRQRADETRSDLDMRRLADTTVVTDAAARVQERDVLVIQISGENSLPTAYTVDAAGNIRLPLLGTLQVRGLTSAQVRTAVTDLLADRQLARGSNITVELRRPR